MPEEVVWSDPPAAAGTSATTSRQRKAAALRERPGQWAIIARGGDNRRTLVTAIRTGKVPAFMPTHDWEAVSRKVGGEVVVYARYVGQNGSQP